LAHPLGANFREGVLRFFIIPTSMQRLRISFTGMTAKQGTDPYYNSGLNYGNNPRRDNDTRVSNFDIRMLQGFPTRIVSYRCDVSYMLRHNLPLSSSFARSKVPTKGFTQPVAPQHSPPAF
jgi:hypothetical protein